MQIPMQTILVVEDERDVAELIGFNLERAGMQAILVRDGLEAFDAAIRGNPDLVLLDLMLPGKDGYAVLRDLRADARTRDVPVLMLTAKAQTADRIKGLTAGVDDYLTKPFSPKEMVLRIRAILGRVQAGSDAVECVFGSLRFERNYFRCYLDENLLDLTPLEYKLLLFLAERSGKVQSRTELFRCVWGYGDGARSRTLDSHLKRLREKLGRHACIIETVRGVGYRFVGEKP